MAKGRDRGFTRRLFSGQFYDDVISDSDITSANIKYVRKSGDDSSGDGSTGSPYKTIAKAMSGAVDTRGYVTGTGDRFMIIIGPGEYHETIDCRHPHGHAVSTLRGRPIGNITVRGENFLSATIIDAHTNPRSRYPSIVYGYTSGSIFENLVFRNVTGSGNTSFKQGNSLDLHPRMVNHPWSGGDGDGNWTWNVYNGVGGTMAYHNMVRFLYCEHSQSKGGQANGILVEALNHSLHDLDRWPLRVDNCIFRGGGPAASAISNAGIAISIGNATGGGATGSFATNNIIYYYANGIYTGGSNQAQIINNTILSCSHTGIETYRASKIYNNIIAGCAVQGSAEYGLVYDDDYDAEIRYNIVTGNVSNAVPNVLHDIRESSDSTNNSYPETNSRIDPQLASTGSVDDRNNGVAGEIGDGVFGHDVGTFNFAPASPTARCIDFGYPDKLSSIGYSDVRGVLRETEKDRKVKHIQTLVSIDVGAVELRYYQARGGNDGQSGQTMDGDFTINTYNNTSADYNRPAEDNDVGLEFRAPISLSVAGVPNLHPPTDARKTDAYRITLGDKSQPVVGDKS